MYVDGNKYDNVDECRDDASDKDEHIVQVESGRVVLEGYEAPDALQDSVDQQAFTIVTQTDRKGIERTLFWVTLNN